MSKDLLRKFEADLDAFAKEIGKSQVEAVKEVTMELHNLIVERTPFKTGRAKLSWNIGVGNADESVFPKIPEGRYTRDGAEAAAREQWRALDGLQPGQPVHISNNLHYIIALENGHSPQAPPGTMLELSVAEVEVLVQKIGRGGR